MTIANGPSGGVGIALRDPLPWAELKQIAQTAEDTGYVALFVPEIAAREAFSTLAALAGGTSRMFLGTGVVTMWSRNPITCAMAAATVQDVSKGRMVLGIGAGTPPGPRAADHASHRGPIALIRDYARLIRSVLAGEIVASGEPFEVDGFQLALEASGGPPPIWLGALGDRMLALAGEIADGVIMNWCTPERVAEARGVIDEAARAAGRDPSAITLSVYVRACLGVEEATALRALGEMTAQYASSPHYRRQMERMGLGPEAARAAEAMAEGRLDGVPSDLIQALTVMGGRDDALARFARYGQAGADLVICYPVSARDPYSSVLGTVLAAAPSPASLS